MSRKSTKTLDIAEAEYELKQVSSRFTQEGPQKHSQLTGKPHEEAEIVQIVAKIVERKSKRLKQHARRAKARAAKRVAGKQQAEKGEQTKPSPDPWPRQIKNEAVYHGNWRFSLFMYVAGLAVARYLQAQKLQVHISDDMLQTTDIEDIKELIENNAKCIGVSKYKVSKHS